MIFYHHDRKINYSDSVIISEGDVMSSSTISKAEECARLKDLEDSFEDKYTKVSIF